MDLNKLVGQRCDGFAAMDCRLGGVQKIIYNSPMLSLYESRIESCH